MSIRPLNKERSKWQIDFYPAGKKGKRQRSSMVGTEIEAIQFELAVRRIHAEDTPANPRIGDAVHKWILKCKNNLSPNTVTDIEKFQKNQLKFFTAIRFTMLTGTHIEKYKKKRLEDGVKPRTINKELSYLSGLISYAVKEKYCNPLPFKIEHIPGDDAPNPDILSWDEITKLIDHLEDKYLCILLLFADTALRKVEALNMTAERINIPAGTFRVKGKNGKDETLPIPTKRLRIALEKIVEDVGGKGFLFINSKTGKPYTTIRKALKRAAISAKINKRVYHHLLRHCYGSHCIEAGIDIRVVQKLMRHSTLQVTERYTQISERFKEAETQKYASIAERESGPMQKIVGGKRYNTQNAELIAEKSNCLMITDPAFFAEKLFRTTNGSWFLFGEGGAHTRYGLDTKRLDRDIIPLSEIEAQFWLERYSTVECVEKFFDTVIEDA